MPGRADRLRKPAMLTAAVPLALLLVLIAGWAIDSSIGGRQVMRNVSVAGQSVGGLSQDELVPVLDEVAMTLADRPVNLIMPDTTLESSAGALGLALDKEGTAAAALAIGRDDPLPLRPFVWFSSFFKERNTKARFSVDDTMVASELARLEDQIRTPAVNPRLGVEGDQVIVVAGRAGRGLDPTGVADQLRSIEVAGGEVIDVRVNPTEIPADIADAQAQELADQVNKSVGTSLTGVLDGEPRNIDGRALRALVSSSVSDGNIELTLDQTKTLELLQTTFEGIGTEPGRGTVTVSRGLVVVNPGEDGTACCTPGSVAEVAKALREGRSTVDLTLTTVASGTNSEYFDKLGIKEKVAEFTTNHPSGQSRVTNIHQMADAVRGAIIQPGQTFSLNNHVGRRTAEKGYVAAGIIDGTGHFSEEVGGGVSQFTTTLFNAAFFAGLDIPEYRAHSLYISRYPYGRESTIDFGSLDLKITNITPYGILIWPTYTDGSITVALYSTRYIEAGQVSQSEQQSGAVCVSVTTTRQRTFINTGEVRFDEFYARYAPAQGVRCDGSKLDPEGNLVTTTSAPPLEETTTTVPEGEPTTTVAEAPPSTTATTQEPVPTTTAEQAGGAGATPGDGDGGGGGG